MTSYRRGRKFEWDVRDDLADNGYAVVRAAGSKGDTKVDLVAFKPGQQLLVQCKGSGRCDPAEWDRLYEVAGWVGAVPLLAEKAGRGKGIAYTRLLGPKVPRARTQPCVPFVLDVLAVAA